MPLRGAGGNALLKAGGTGGHQLWPQVSPRAGVSLAGEHNPCCSHPCRKSIVPPKSSPEECSAFFGSCSATPADHIASAETCVKSHLKMEFHGFLGDLGNSYRNAHWARGLDYTFRFPILRLTIIREAVFSVSSSLHRDRVMEARFDVCMIWLLIVVRAIDGVMFRREAWVVRSRLYTETCFRLMPYSQGDPPGRGPSA